MSEPSTPSPINVAMNSGAPDLDVTAASESQLLTEVTRVGNTIREANILDPMVPDLLRRERSIRQELGRREVLLMQGILWTGTTTGAAASAPGHAFVNVLKSRNGRGGPGGPGNWDD